MIDPNVASHELPAAERIDPRQAVGPQLCGVMRDQIIRGELAPGSRLLRTEIATKFGISRQPVSDACARLAEEGLVDILPQRGTFVSRINVSAVLSARFVRESVEVEIVRRLAAERSTAMLDECARLLEEQRRQIDTPDQLPFMALDEAFHFHLSRSAGQAAAWRILQPLKTQMDRLRHISARELPRRLLIEQHETFVDAIGRRDPEAAVAGMRDHLRQMLDDLPALIESHADYFDTRGAVL
ncbi:GntR family transcriptional regulator [Palleronia pelagia]|uniref:DNA-binding transcriptional regulator, GntR family n=1 Tax=Palleronia pelagia TaxID=387096 RepID=A0A1H8CUV5_9RHOB|nr:GntR family transcriptional regulator [Palleronia pelagia]SEM98662.1 DNA-binding transcriptional regulator, GntR family [Palleronia pelagia]